MVAATRLGVLHDGDVDLREPGAHGPNCRQDQALSERLTDEEWVAVAPLLPRPAKRSGKPRGRPMPPHVARGNATRARIRSRVEHVFAAEKQRMGLVVRAIGLARATAKITLANLAYNIRRLVWIGGATAPA